jgi:UDP-N-acetylmuramate: L-alanyl-gamma-D-glutamyl-meso-diaminopimelate ligase
LKLIDLQKNRIPEAVRTIHLIAACGTGMGALACALKELGYRVTGSDQKVYPPMSTFLEQKGIVLEEGFKGRYLAEGPDLVVVGNAVSRDNPEVVQMVAMGLDYCSMPQAVTHFMADGKKIILATGTHGKTTTASLLAWLFYRAGLDPSFMVGGILKNFDSNYRVGAGVYIVIEGDEYDTAFFDKGPKFLHYPPHAAVLTSVEFDHADIFADLDAVLAAFQRFIEILPQEGTLYAFDGDENVAGLIADPDCKVLPYGDNGASAWRVGDISINSGQTQFEVFKHGDFYHRFQSPMPGKHNVLNALAAIAVADQAGIPPETIADALNSFEGAKRRQEICGVRNGVTVMDDFAHHPTAVRETVAGVSSFYPDSRLIAVFEPRTNTSMRNVFQDRYPGAFDGADIICIRKPPLLKKIPEGIRFSSEQLVADLKTGGKDARYFSDTDAILDFLGGVAKSGDVVLIMSNGGFDNIHERLLQILS